MTLAVDWRERLKDVDVHAIFKDDVPVRTPRKVLHNRMKFIHMCRNRREGENPLPLRYPKYQHLHLHQNQMRMYDDDMHYH